MSIRTVVMLISCFFFFIGFTVAHADQGSLKKKWTLMIFLNGNNNLDYFATENIKDMEKVGSNDDMNIIVQWASRSRRKVSRLYIQKSHDDSRVTSPIIEELGSVDMGDPRSLDDFIAWTIEHYPAKHYFIDVWNHGSGWAKRRVEIGKDISVDELTGNRISTEQLGRVMSHAAFLMGHKVDIYGSDACLMAMIEVANEMSNSVQYFIGAQAIEPAQGWPYTQLLAKWQALEDATPAAVAEIWPQEFVKAYQPGGVYPAHSATMSVYNLSMLPALNKRLYVLGESIRGLSPRARARLLSDASSVQKFKRRDYVDLIDLMSVLSESGQGGLPLEEFDNVVTAARAMIVANKATVGYSHANGISVWLPMNTAMYSAKSVRYKDLRFSIDTQWDLTIESLLQGMHDLSSQH